MQHEAAEQDLDVRLEVLSANVDAKRLYERLGFRAGAGVELPHLAQLIQMSWDHSRV